MKIFDLIYFYDFKIIVNTLFTKARVEILISSTTLY